MTINQLSDSTQDYLKAIWLAGEWSDEPITATSIAQRVGVTMSTTSDALRRLREAGLIDHAPYSAITLTESAEARSGYGASPPIVETFLSRRWDTRGILSMMKPRFSNTRCQTL